MTRFLFMILIILITQACNRCEPGCVNGTCVKRLCECDNWYTGDRCDRSSLSEYQGSYSGLLNWTSDSTEALSFNAIVSPLDPSVIVLDSVSLECHFQDQSRFEVPAQVWRGGTVVGEGEMLINLMSMNLRFEGPNVALSDITLEVRK